MFQIVRQLKKDGITVIYISHRLEELFILCDRVTVLRDGQYVADENVVERNNTIVSNSLRTLQRL